jgi:hypothetical protein
MRIPDLYAFCEKRHALSTVRVEATDKNLSFFLFSQTGFFDHFSFFSSRGRDASSLCSQDISHFSLLLLQFMKKSESLSLGKMNSSLTSSSLLFFLLTFKAEPLKCSYHAIITYLLIYLPTKFQVFLVNMTMYCSYLTQCPAQRLLQNRVLRKCYAEGINENTKGSY